MSTVQRQVVVVNERGLHARPAMQFVEVANSFECNVVVEKPGAEIISVDGKSIMEMITLEAVQGTSLIITCSGSDAEKAAEKLASLFDSKFGED